MLWTEQARFAQDHASFSISWGPGTAGGKPSAGFSALFRDPGAALQQKQGPRMRRAALPGLPADWQWEPSVLVTFFLSARLLKTGRSAQVGLEGAAVKKFRWSFAQGWDPKLGGA